MSEPTTTTAPPPERRRPRRPLQPPPPRHPRARLHDRAALVTVCLAVVVSLATLGGVVATTKFSEGQDFPSVVRDDPRLDAFSELSDAQTLDLGRHACSELARGSDRMAVASQVASNHSVDTRSAIRLVSTAVKELCPEHK